MADATSGGKRWLIAPTVGLAAFMEVLDISIANVALQHIAGSLAASLDEATWVLTSYLVANAIVLPMSGWLAGAIGRRRYFLGCIAGFSVTSLLCGLAPSLPLLIVARALQGITGGGLQPNSQAILADAFPPNKRGQAFAIYGISVVFAPAIGPTLGGWITDNFSWRWVFLLNVPVGALLSLLAARGIVDPPEPRAALKTGFKQGLRFDTIGFAFLVIGMCALQVVLDKGQEDDWWSSAFITDLAVVAAVALTAFVIWELRRPDPIVDLRLLANRNFAFGNILMFMVGFVLLSSTVLLPLYAQAVLGYTATEAGKVISPGGFAVMLMMPFVGLLVTRVDARWLIAFGLIATSLALFNMMRFDTNVDYATLAWARIYQSVGLGFLFIPVNTIAFLGLPAAKNNDASALINMMRNLGGSFGIAIATTVLARRQQHHHNVLIGNVTAYSSAYDTTIQAMQQAIGRNAANAADALHQAQAQLYAMVQRQALALSYIDAFWLLAVIFAAMLPLVLLLRKPDPGGAGVSAH